MFKKTMSYLTLACLLLSVSMPVFSHPRTNVILAAEAGCCLGLLCCFLARAPEGSTLDDRSKLGLGLMTAFMLADTGLNVATAIVDNYAKKDIENLTDSIRNNYDAATALSGLSAGFMLFATLGGLPEMLGATVATLFSFMGVGSVAGALAANVIAYNKVKDSQGITDTQEAARDLSIASVIGNSIAMIVHPVWFYYRIKHPSHSPA